MDSRTKKQKKRREKRTFGKRRKKMQKEVSYQTRNMFEGHQNTEVERSAEIKKEERWTKKGGNRETKCAKGSEKEEK